MTTMLLAWTAIRPNRARPAFIYFFFNDTATTEIYTLSLHDALPISTSAGVSDVIRTAAPAWDRSLKRAAPAHSRRRDRKSTRLNSSHLVISYAVFCLKKKSRALSARRRCSEPGRPVARTAPEPHVDN